MSQTGYVYKTVKNMSLQVQKLSSLYHLISEKDTKKKSRYKHHLQAKLIWTEKYDHNLPKLLNTDNKKRMRIHSVQFFGHEFYLTDKINITQIER